MKLSAALVGLALAVALAPAHAQQSADDQYVAIFGLMAQADALEAAGQPRQALEDYTQALDGLQKLQSEFPGWDPAILNYRLRYLTDKVNDLKGLEQSLSPATAAANPMTPATNAVSAPPETDAERQLSAFRAQVEALQGENGLLLAKLKEAWSIQPATTDPRELARAQAQALSLRKENDLLLASLGGGATNLVPPADVTRLQQALADANRKLAEATDRANHLAQENQTLQSDAKASALEKAALEQRLRQRPAGETSAPAGAGDEVKTLRARLAVDEARAVPYTPEELALLKPPAPAAAVPAGGREKPVNQLPSGTALLVAEAQGYFSAGEYDKAAADYVRILELDPTNGLVLANLAEIELQQGKLDDAERSIEAALKQSPDDAYDLTVLAKWNSAGKNSTPRRMP